MDGIRLYFIEIIDQQTDDFIKDRFRTSFYPCGSLLTFTCLETTIYLETELQVPIQC